MFGLSGKCVGADEATQALRLMCDDGSVITAQVSWVSVPPTGKSQPLRVWKHMSQDAKVGFMVGLGRWDEARQPNPLETVTKLKPKELTSEHLLIFNGLLEWSFPRVSYKMYPPELSRTFSDFTPELQNEHYKVLKQCIQDCVEKHQLNLFPLMDCQHATMLVLERDESGHIAVRYYETLAAASERCKEMAETILRAFTSVDPENEPVLVTNKFQQNGSDCVLCMAHYSEIEVRHAAGEGWGSVPGALKPQRMLAIRATIGGSVTVLEKARLKWIEDMKREEAFAETLRIQVAEKRAKVKEAKAAQASLVAALGAKAVKATLAGTGLPDPEAPEPAKPQKKAKKAQAEMPETSLPLEAPEGGSARS